MSDRTGKLGGLLRKLLILTCIIAAYVYGVISISCQLFPYQILRHAYWGTKPYFCFQKPHYLFPVRYDRKGAKTYHLNELAPGLTLVTTYWKEFDWKPGICLIDAQGKKLHSWAVDPSVIWPKSPHKDFMAGRLNIPNNYVHGSYLFENGDILFNVEWMGLVRMNSRGEVKWRLPYRTHHSVFRAENGDFWVSGMKWVENTPQGRERIAKYPGLKPPLVEDYAVKVSPEGEIVKEISLVEVLFNADYEYLFWKIGKKFSEDIAHLNKVEELSSGMADQYPLFEAGDLLISMKFIHAVFVFDPDTGKVKWLTTGPFLEQHDPKFIGNGWIAIFDNHSDGSDEGKYLGGSRIIAVKPGTDEVREMYPTRHSDSFYTDAGGKFQVLDNGNLLITEARAGRVFETDPSGRTIWEWIHEPISDDLIPEVMEGSRYKITPAQVASWK